ncbi:hypothetical protein Plhal304r1_c018g0063911 [Plasmopara halstedii]
MSEIKCFGILNLEILQIFVCLELFTVSSNFTTRLCLHLREQAKTEDDAVSPP